MATRATAMERVLMHLGLCVVQVGYAGYAVLTRVALTSGLSRYIFPVYRDAIALLLLAPISFFLERRQRPALTLPLLAHFFILGLLGVFGNQVLYLAGLYYTNSTITTLMQNLVPVFTFLLAAVSGVEKVQWRRHDGIAKLLGTVAAVTGAVVVTAYKGPVLLGQHEVVVLGTTGLSSWHVGILCLVGNCLAWAAYLNLQAPVLTIYPAPVSLAAFSCFFGALQLLALALVMVRDPAAWIPVWGAEVLAVVYAGVIASGFNMGLQAWCVQIGGPLLVAVHQPLQAAVVAVLALVFLGDTLCLGSLVGSVFIILGLYSVIWGQAEGRRLAAMDEESRTKQQPLLHQTEA